MNYLGTKVTVTPLPRTLGTGATPYFFKQERFVSMTSQMSDIALTPASHARTIRMRNSGIGPKLPPDIFSIMAEGVV